MKKWIAIGAAAAIGGAIGGYALAQSSAPDYLSGLVIGIQGVPIAATPPIFGQVLMYNSKQNRYIPSNGGQLPTACGVLPTGTLWNSSGTVSVCP